eukprot:scaffold1691_cov107-Isochrysis_galbana.AAC.8
MAAAGSLQADVVVVRQPPRLDVLRLEVRVPHPKQHVRPALEQCHLKQQKHRGEDVVKVPEIGVNPLRKGHELGRFPVRGAPRLAEGHRRPVYPIAGGEQLPRHFIPVGQQPAKRVVPRQVVLGQRHALLIVIVVLRTRAGDDARAVVLVSVQRVEAVAEPSTKEVNEED